MSVIASLCDRGIVLDRGEVSYVGDAIRAVRHYQHGDAQNACLTFDPISAGLRIGDERATLHRVACCDSQGRVKLAYDLDDQIEIRMTYEIHRTAEKLYFPNYHVFDERGEYVFVTTPNPGSPGSHINEPGRYESRGGIPPNLLNVGSYTIGVAMTFMDPGVHVAFFERDALSFQVVEQMDHTLDGTRHGYAGVVPGPIRPILDWNINPTIAGSSG
jgi:hypothetical protein